MGWLPTTASVIAAEVTADSTTMPKEPVVNSPRMISRAKNAPAIGALNADAIPAAAPHPTSMAARLSGRCSNWEIPAPAAAPTCTLGSSGPADPPLPRVIDAPTTRISALTTSNLPPFMSTASITPATPCPFSPLSRNFTRSPTIKPPTAGENTIHHDLEAAGRNTEVLSEKSCM